MNQFSSLSHTPSFLPSSSSLSIYLYMYVYLYLSLLIYHFSLSVFFSSSFYISPSLYLLTLVCLYQLSFFLIFKRCGKPLVLVVNAEDSQSEPWSFDMGSNLLVSTQNARMAELAYAMVLEAIQLKVRILLWAQN